MAKKPRQSKAEKSLRKWLKSYTAKRERLIREMEAPTRFKTIDFYERYGVSDLNKATKEQLRPLIKSAASTANSRLKRLEDRTKEYKQYGIDVDLTKHSAYKRAMKQMTEGRTRFRSDVERMEIDDLKREYRRLRDFLTAPTSTLQGANSAMIKRYYTAQGEGFKGSYGEFIELSSKVWTKENEKRFGSDILYLIASSQDENVYESVIEAYEKKQQRVAKATGKNPADIEVDRQDIEEWAELIRTGKRLRGRGR